MTNQQVKVRVHAKVNLALHVGRVIDGYHELGTVFQAVSLADDIVATLAPAGEFRLCISGEGADLLPVDDRNLALKAARNLANVVCPDAGVQLSIYKRIPIAGGMAGGSADAAGTLLACAKLWGLDLANEMLFGQAKQLGADVPFGLLGGVALGQGRGDELSPLPCRGELHWVFATSQQGLSTPKVFARFDQLSNPRPIGISEELIAALAVGDVPTIGRLLTNDLQRAAVDLRPQLATVLQVGREMGALGAVVSGSGPTCAFLAADLASANVIANQLASLEQVQQTHLATGPAPGAQLS